MCKYSIEPMYAPVEEGGDIIPNEDQLCGYGLLDFSQEGRVVARAETREELLIYVHGLAPLPYLRSNLNPEATVYVSK